MKPDSVFRSLIVDDNWGRQRFFIGSPGVAAKVKSSNNDADVDAFRIKNGDRLELLFSNGQNMRTIAKVSEASVTVDDMGKPWTTMTDVLVFAAPLLLRGKARGRSRKPVYADVSWSDFVKFKIRRMA